MHRATKMHNIEWSTSVFVVICMGFYLVIAETLYFTWVLRFVIAGTLYFIWVLRFVIAKTLYFIWVLRFC